MADNEQDTMTPPLSGSAMAGQAGEWTPGPWLKGEGLEPLGGCLMRLIMGVDSAVAEVLYDDEEDPTAEANARLIAAAPCMAGQLESAQVDLDLLRRAIEEGDPKAELLIRVTDLWKRNDAALAKARGK